MKNTFNLNTAENIQALKGFVGTMGLVSEIPIAERENLVATYLNMGATTHISAVKHDDGKAPMNLLSREALEQTAMVMAFGKEKYAAHNWRKGFAWSRPLSAAMRHLMAFNDGEDKDPESGLSHLAHAACCIMFLLEFEKTHKDLDDRFKPTDK